MLSRQEYLGQLIATARRRLKQAVLNRARRFRLSPLQFWTLLTLHEHAGATLGELARLQGVDAPTASRVVAALKRRGLLRLTADQADRRRARIELSVAGLALLPELEVIAVSVRAALVEGLTAAQERALRASLVKVIGNLERFDLATSARSQKSRRS